VFEEVLGAIVKCYLPTSNGINVEKIQFPGMRTILLSNAIAFLSFFL
jgi:hypothetical protein